MRFMLFLMMIFLSFMSLPLLAEELPPEVPEWVQKISEILGPFLGTLIVKWPKFSIVIMIMGFLRTIFKPLVSIAWAIVNLTPTSKDNSFMEKMQNHIAFKIVGYFLDWGASIKIENPKK